MSRSRRDTDRILVSNKLREQVARELVKEPNGTVEATGEKAVAVVGHGHTCNGLVDAVCSKLAYAQVIAAEIAIDGARYNLMLAQGQGGYTIFGVV